MLSLHSDVRLSSCRPRLTTNAADAHSTLHVTGRDGRSVGLLTVSAASRRRPSGSGGIVPPAVGMLRASMPAARRRFLDSGYVPCTDEAMPSSARPGGCCGIPAAAAGFSGPPCPAAAPRFARRGLWPCRLRGGVAASTPPPMVALAPIALRCPVEHVPARRTGPLDFHQTNHA